MGFKKINIFFIHIKFFKKNTYYSRYTNIMKKIKLLNLTIIGSTLLFSACSLKQENIKKEHKVKEVSLYKIMGITEPIQEVSPPITHNYREIKERTPQISPDIEFISYRHINQENAFNFTMIDTIESNAKKFLGVPYVWGATGPNKFDCSGFTQWVYRDVGIHIPRVSKEQARVGEFISYNNLQRGDMVFFDTKKHRTGLVSHVGIYLGDGNFIHASSAGKKVVIYNFNKKNFYKKRFLWGRRVVNQNHYYALN